VNGLFLREGTKTSRNVTISFSQSPERATATRGRGPLVANKTGELIVKTSKGMASRSRDVAEGKGEFACEQRRSEVSYTSNYLLSYFAINVTGKKFQIKFVDL
jgi:hypothetical protein